MKRRTLSDRKELAMREVIRRAIDEHHGNRTQAARTLGIDRSYLLELLNRYGLRGYGLKVGAPAGRETR